MTNYRAFGANDLHRLAHQAVGFDRFIDTLETLVTEKSTFPHHNIVKVADNSYVVELAVAGFSEDEISVEMEKNVLSIKGVKNTEDEREYLHRGIATRSFVKTLTLVDTIEVRSATMENGMLLIQLENIIPEEKLPKKIPITIKGKKELLKG